jgi:hypothetical protein
VADADPLSAYLADARKRLEDRDALVARLSGGASVSAVELNAPQDRLAALFPSLLAAVEAVLAFHALTGYHRHTEACPNHYASMHGRKECPDCKVVEWTGCDTCKDEFGNPARAEDCKTRQAIASALTGEEARWRA